MTSFLMLILFDVKDHNMADIGLVKVADGGDAASGRLNPKKRKREDNPHPDQQPSPVRGNKCPHCQKAVPRTCDLKWVIS